VCDGCNCAMDIKLNPKKTKTTTITSPNYPSKYPKNQKCTWKITATKGKLKLTFDKFNTEWSSNCKKKDYLYVGNVAKYNKLYLCGSSMPSDFKLTSKAKTMILKFKSNKSVAKPGFKATVTATG